MRNLMRSVMIALFSMLTLFGSATLSQAGEPISREQILQLNKLGINSQAIIQKIEADGVDFAGDPGAVDELAVQGVPSEVLAAVKTLSAASNNTPPITYQNVRQLVALGIDETAVIERLGGSPTLFTLDAVQEDELRALGATDRLFTALRGERLTPTPAPRSGEKVTDVAVILDCSGSMTEVTSDGKTKLDVARDVVTNMIHRYPDGLRLSFLVYGGGSGSCDDVRVVRPLSTLDASAKSWLNHEIRQLRAKGKTPIALALRRAGQELAKFDSVSSVVLISDGKETCNGDPAAEAAALAQRFNLRYGVTVFGFEVEGAERSALEEIAAAGDGQYYHAGSATELVQQTASVQEAIEVAPVKVTARGRRAVIVTTPRIQFPAMKRIALIKAGRSLPERHNYRPVMETETYDRPIRIPSGKKKYDLGFLPVEGMAVRLSPEIHIPDRSTIQIRPEDFLGLVNLGGDGLPPVKLVALVRPGRAGPGHNFDPVQTSDRYGADLLVPAGKYDLWILGTDGKRELLEEELEVVAGQRLQLD